MRLSQRASAEKMVAASAGYDLPSFVSFADFKTWAEEGPPKGTLYHYPNPHNHQILSVGAAPAPPRIAHQIYTQAIQTKMVVRFKQGEPMEKTLAWAESESRRLHADLSQCPDSEVRKPSRHPLMRTSESKGHWQLNNSSAVFGFEVPN